jgi:hypothetical protein
LMMKDLDKIYEELQGEKECKKKNKWSHIMLMKNSE